MLPSHHNNTGLETNVAMRNRLYILLFLAILILAISFRLAFFRGVSRVDDFNYLRHAAEVWKGSFELDGALFWHATRPLIFVPISCCFELFGVSEMSATVWPLLASLFTVVLLYFIARELFSREAAIYTMLIAASFPMLVDESTRVIPGPIINFLVAMSAFLFIRSERAEKHRAIWLFLSGIAFGKMPLAGRLGIAFGCFYPIAILLNRRHRLLSYWPLVSGILAVFFFDIMYQWIATGDPFFSDKIARKILSNEVAAFQPFYYLKLIIKSYHVNGIVLYLSGAGALVGLWKRDRKVVFITAWFLATWAIIEYGSSSITTYRPLFKMMRFMSILTVPAAILAGKAFGELHALLLKERSSPWFAITGKLAIAFALGFTMASSALGLERLSRNEKQFRVGLDRIKQIVRANRGSSIYVTHWLWNTRVGFFMGYEDDYFPSGYEPYSAVLLEKANPESRNHYVQLLSPGEKIEGILIHDEYLFNLKRQSGQTSLQGAGEIPQLLAHPLAAWQLIERITIGPEDVVAVYKIPPSAWPADVGKQEQRLKRDHEVKDEKND